ncbi:MAG: GTP 3',8-cyclase MoaA [Pseudomonadota bacterium]
MIATGNRPINYLRISITDRCNFKCIYCMPGVPFAEIKHEQIARYEEILKITRIACELGITKVRITGGEPFVRKGIFSFLEQLSAIESLKDISITTNGALLTRDKIAALIKLGIKRLNFSLDTLDPAKFKAITGKDNFQTVWNAILSAHESGIFPVKINAVALKGINDDEIATLAALTLEYPFHIRFIEYMPMGDAAFKAQDQILTDQIKQKIESSLGMLLPVEHVANDGPAKKFTLQNAKGIIGFITPVSSHFCSDCNRLRLTARGALRPCLLDNYEKDILGPLRNNASDDQLKEIILSTLAHKPEHHCLSSRTAKDMPISHMTSIGG